MKIDKEFARRINVESERGELRSAINIFRNIEHEIGIPMECIDIDYIKDNERQYVRVDINKMHDTEIINALLPYHKSCGMHHKFCGIYHMRLWFSDGKTHHDIGKANGFWFNIDPVKMEYNIDECYELARTYLSEGWVPEEYKKELQKLLDIDTNDVNTRLMVAMFNTPLTITRWVDIWYIDNFEIAKKLAEFFIVFSD